MTKKFESMIDDACYGAIITWEGDVTTKANLKEFAYSEEIMGDCRCKFGKEIRFYGAEKIKAAVSDYIDRWFPEYDDDTEFEVYQ